MENKKEELKQEVIVLSVVAVIFIILAIVIGIMESNNSSKDESKSQTLENTTTQELMVDGITKENLENMKGLMDKEQYEIYNEYFENNGEKSIEEIKVEKSMESGYQEETGGVDHITEEEQAELDQALTEALEKYNINY